MEKILDIIDLIAYDKGLDNQVVLEIVKEGLVKIAREEINPYHNYFVEEDSKERTLRLFYRMKVCADDKELNEEEKAIYIPLSLSSLSMPTTCPLTILPTIARKFCKIWSSMERCS